MKSSNIQRTVLWNRGISSRPAAVGLILAVVLGASVFAAEDKWDRADRAVSRLQPAAFGKLPAVIRARLERLGCRIPQPSVASDPVNVVSGHFVTAGRTDWAVLCSRDRVSSILVFPGGSVEKMESLATAPDRNYLQGAGDDRIEFSRTLHAAGPRTIGALSALDGGAAPTTIDHEGIEDRFEDKGSEFWYWHEGRWRRLADDDD